MSKVPHISGNTNAKKFGFWESTTMLKLCAWLIFFIVATTTARAESGLRFKGDFETGKIQPKVEPHDGFFIKTLPEPQGSVKEVSIASGGAAPDSGLDTRVVQSDLVGGEVVKPRSGDFFIRSAIYYNKDYSGFAGNSGKNKPRSSITLSQHDFAYDEEGYIGFSIYVPKNFEDELGRKGHQGKSMLLTVTAPSAETFFNLNVWVPENDSEAHWFVQLQLNPESVSEKHPATIIEQIDLGRVAPDKGKWTDFVIRFRSNPFAVTTNPAKKGIPNAKDRTFEGNRGILQVWKAEGKPDSKGNRLMTLKIDKENTPVGLVPHETWQLDHSFRIYKHGWHHNPTTVDGPVWFGFDEIRFGVTAQDGTNYSVVHPAALACTDGCPSGSSSSPAPPKGLIVVQ